MKSLLLYYRSKSTEAIGVLIKTPGDLKNRLIKTKPYMLVIPQSQMPSEELKQSLASIQERLTTFFPDKGGKIIGRKRAPTLAQLAEDIWSFYALLSLWIDCYSEEQFSQGNTTATSRVEAYPDDEEFVVIPVPDELLEKAGIAIGSELEVSVKEGCVILSR